jgi:hypothetical protein
LVYPLLRNASASQAFFCTHPEVPSGVGGLGLAAYARVLYLSPRLADVDHDVAVASVAHELAHIFLDHEVYAVPPDVYKRQEDEAWELIREWGFAKEEKAHEEYSNEKK